MNTLTPLTRYETNASTVLKVIDAATGVPDTTLTYLDFTLWYRIEVRPGNTPLAVVSGVSAVDLATPAVTDAHLDNAVIHLRDGAYRVDLPDAALAGSNAHGLTVGATVTDKIVIEAYHPLVQFNLSDSEGFFLNKSARMIIEGTTSAATPTTCTTDLNYPVDELTNGVVIFDDGQRAKITSNTAGPNSILTYTGGTKTAVGSVTDFVIV